MPLRRLRADGELRRLVRSDSCQLIDVTAPGRLLVTGKWRVDDISVSLNREGREFFRDSRDHWDNAVVRLIGLDSSAVRLFVEAACRNAVAEGHDDLSVTPIDESIRLLRTAGESELGVPPDCPPPVSLDTAPPAIGNRPDVMWADSVPGHSEFKIIGNAKAGLGWLVEAQTMKRPLSGTVEYEEQYFEGDETRIGYGDYQAQEAWRTEKSRRQVRQVAAVCQFVGSTLESGSRVLDIGAGYGFFRHALEEAGFAHYGLEVSSFANSVSESTFGFSSFVGELDDFARSTRDRYDAIVMWDVLEHVDDPVALLVEARELLGDGGLLFVRTPNVDSVEREVFGACYHSFKIEHLWYFAPLSLVAIMETAGLEPVFLSTESHLLRGFFGDVRVAGVARLLRGSDIFVAAQKGVIRFG